MLVKASALFFDLEHLLISNYWNPKTIFNLGILTGGLAIEDLIFSFFVGGIATFGYEAVFNKKVRIKNKHRHHIRAIVGAIVLAGIFAAFLKPNPIYALIAFGFSGAMLMWLERRDLVRHSIYGGLIFTAIYFLAFTFFDLLFPNFVHQSYNLSQISGVLVFKIPLEELMYALSFGLLWAPIYEYEHGSRAE